MHMLIQCNHNEPTYAFCLVFDQYDILFFLLGNVFILDPVASPPLKTLDVTVRVLVRCSLCNGLFVK